MNKEDIFQSVKTLLPLEHGAVNVNILTEWHRLYPIINMNKEDIFQSVETLFSHGAINVISTEQHFMHSIKILYSQCDLRRHLSVSRDLIGQF